MNLVSTRLRATLLNYWHSSSAAQRLLFITGSLLFVVMIVHGLALVAMGGSLDGPVSLRKVMTFAETLGLTCWCIGWMLPFFRLERRATWLIAGFTAAFALSETTLFAIQAWRGVPSHYNFTTPFDGFVYLSTGAGAAGFTIVTVALLIWSSRLHQLTPSLRLAIRTGLLINMLGYSIGVIMSLNSGGIWQGLPHFLATLTNNPSGSYLGPAPGTIGGNLVVLHAIGVHGLQLVPLAAWLLSYSRLPEGRRTTLSAAVAASTVALFAILGVQAFRALPLSSIDPLTAVLLLLSGLALFLSYAAVGWWTLQGLWPHLHPAYTSRHPTPRNLQA